MSILTPAYLRQLAAFPLLQSNWHFLSAAVLSVCNQPADIPALYQHALAVEPPARHAEVSAQFREALLKAAALIGLPRTINALTELKNVTPPELRAAEAPLRRDAADFSGAGGALFDKVYGKISSRIHHQLRAAYPDLEWFVIKHEYGPLLAYDKILDGKQTSLVIVASLVPQSVNPQLKGHLKGALNQGATTEEVNSVRDLALLIAGWSGVSIRGEPAKL